jgi:polyhydroxybutyrate depolymerase
MRVIRTLVSVAFLALAPWKSQADSPEKPGPGTHERTIEHAGLTRTYRIHVPPSYDGSRPVSLVLAFHGGGGSSLGAERGLGFNPLSDAHGFLVVYPEGVEHHWNDGRIGPRFPKATEIDDVGFIRSLIDQLTKMWKIDPRRVYATGMSNGGFFSHRLGWELSDVLAAVAPAAGTLDPDIAAQFAPKHPVHVLHMHGTDDRAVPHEGGEVVAKGGHCISVPAMIDLWVKANGCRVPPRVEYVPEKDPDDGTKVRRETYEPGEKGATVLLYAIEGQGHNWAGRPAGGELAGKPTKELDAAAVIWEFFEKHPKCAGDQR